MPRTSTEVVVGPGTLYIAPTGTAFPTTPATTPVTWSDIGYSEEGWSFNVDRTLEDVLVAEELDPLQIVQTARDVHLVGAAAQASLENLQTAMGGGTVATVANTSKIYTPGNTGTIARKALLLRVTLGTGKNRDIRIPYAVSAGAVEMAHRKAPDKALIAIDFRVVKVTGEDLFTIYDDLTP